MVVADTEIPTIESREIPMGNKGLVSSLIRLSNLSASCWYYANAEPCC